MKLIELQDEFLRSEFKTLTNKLAAAGGYWGQFVIDELLLNSLDNAPDIFYKLSQPILDALKKSNSFNEMQKALPELLNDLNTSKLEEHLLNTIFLGDLTGHLESDLEINNSIRESKTKNLSVLFRNDLSESQLINDLKLCFDKAPEIVVRFFKNKGLKISWNWQEQQQIIKDYCFTVAKASSADILQMFYDEITTAIESGTSLDQFKEDVSKKLEANGWQLKPDGTEYRLDTIYRMNLQGAYMAGSWQSQQKAIEVLPYREFNAVLDNRTTFICRSLNGTVLPATDPFWDTRYPPLHYNCRSRTRLLDKDLMDKYGLNIAKPSDYEHIQPAQGFDTAPGYNWQPDLTKYSTPISDNLKKILP